MTSLHPDVELQDAILQLIRAATTFLMAKARNLEAETRAQEVWLKNHEKA